MRAIVSDIYIIHIIRFSSAFSAIRVRIAFFIREKFLRKMSNG